MRKKIIILLVIGIILLPIIIIGIIYLKSDKFELENLFTYIENDYKPYFKYNSASVDKKNKLCVIKFERLDISGEKFVKQTSIITNKIDQFLEENPSYFINNYKIEIWFNQKACGELFEVRNYDQNSIVNDNFNYLFQNTNGIEIKSVAKYYPNVECLAYMNFREDQYPDFKLFKNLRYLDVGFGGYKKYEDNLLKDFPNTVKKYNYIKN